MKSKILKKNYLVIPQKESIIAENSIRINLRTQTNATEIISMFENVPSAAIKTEGKHTVVITFQTSNNASVVKSQKRKKNFKEHCWKYLGRGIAKNAEEKKVVYGFLSIE